MNQGLQNVNGTQNVIAWAAQCFSGYYHIMRNQSHVHVVTLSITTAASLLLERLQDG
jgi:hypothetical protein